MSECQVEAAFPPPVAESAIDGGKNAMPDLNNRKQEEEEGRRGCCGQVQEAYRMLHLIEGAVLGPVDSHLL